MHQKRKEISEIIIPEDATVVEGPKSIRSIDGDKITYFSDFVARLTQDLRGGENHQIQLLKKGDLVTVSAIKKGESSFPTLVDTVSLTYFVLGFWLARILEEWPKSGWIANSDLEFVDLETDPIVYRDQTKPANNTVWYSYNPLRWGTSEDFERVEREAKEVIEWGQVNSVSFMHGYVTIGLGDSMSIEELEKLPQVLGT